MFSFVADRCWGLGDIYSLAVLSFVRWLLPPWNNTLGKTETTRVQKFQFISPRVTAVVGYLGKPDSANQTPESKQVLMIWCVSRRSKT